ncbi:MAG: (4Fe-4S)-binding protein [Meiothermus silvanus]|nr:(4Fe-4S)-binding protein [Allomeiothermus silvanus]
MDRGKAYPAPGIRVYYQPRLCIHAAECVRGLPEVFDTSRKPWIQPEQASAEAIAEVIRRCPSGALQYERLDGGPQEPAPQSSSVRLVPDGPLYVRGPLTLKDPEGNVIFQGTRAALCRCGASKNKPFCDNSHLETGFQAPPGELDFGPEE